MGKFINVGVCKNKKNGQFVLNLPKKKISKKLLFDLGKSKKMKISIEKLYPK